MGDKCGAHSHRGDGEAIPVGPTPWSDGKRYWRSFDELSATPEFQSRLHREFPRYASEWTDDLSRRNFMKVMGASLALAGAAGCFKKPEQQIAPYVTQPEMITPGIPLHFATCLPVLGYGRGVVVRSDEAKPNKIEGNEKHPASLGATDAITQAMLLSLYDPDRSQSVVNDGVVSSWDRFITEPRNGVGTKLEALKKSKGQGLRILSESIASPTLGALLTDLFKALPNAKWYLHDPVGRTNARAGAELAFGKDRRGVQAVYHFDKAARVLALDSNFMADEPGSVRYARDFIDGRRVREARREMNRLYAVEGSYTITGAMADHRLAVKPSRVEAVARAVASAVGLSDSGAASGLTAEESKFAAAAAADLGQNRGNSLVVAGEWQPAAVHALAHAINDRLGNVGKTVTYIDRVETYPAEPNESLADLAKEMDAGAVEMLLILDANPVYSNNADVDFRKSLEAFSRATDGLRQRYVSVRHGLYDDETSQYCQWHLPATHGLESWGDLRAYDGTAAFAQPLISPLYEGRSTLELISLLASRLIDPPAGQRGRGGDESAYEVVRRHWRDNEKWQDLSDEKDFEIFWETCLHAGVIPNTAFKPLDDLRVSAGAVAASSPAPGGAMEIIFRPDPNVWDGRYANNGWLQELPKPLSKITWDNAVLLSRATAEKLGVNNDDVVGLKVDGRELVKETGAERCAVWIVPGHADDCATIYLGYGRTRAGKVVEDGFGFNAFTLRSSASPHFAGGEVTKKGNKYQIVTTQGSQSMEGRDLIRIGTPEFAFKEADKEEVDPYTAPPPKPESQSQGKGIRHPLPLITTYPETPDHKGGVSADPQWQAWGMVIDNNACIGCNACVVACQAENNIPVVGKDQVSRGREMHWLRIDTYFEGAFDAEGKPGEASAERAYYDSTNRGGVPSGSATGPGSAGVDKEGRDVLASGVHAFFEPVPCMQCEKAPCEIVCPVGATMHDVEGINNMVYNRCVGTRYCSNNCPYKVRRFNFLQYTDTDSKSLALGRNPDVTVRNRGVMEKCNYCVQRISAARIASKKAGKYTDTGMTDGDGKALTGKPIIEDGAVQTACQQACPTEAIFFGDISDEKSQVRKLKEEPLNYVLLEELQTRPRTSYLWRLTNPNAELVKG